MFESNLRDESELNRNRIEITAIVIAVYTAIIFEIPNLFPWAAETSLLWSYLIYNVFVFMGSIIDLLLFLYISFSALELMYVGNWPKEVFPGFILDAKRAKFLKEFSYDLGVRMIFGSFFLPFLDLPDILHRFSKIKHPFLIGIGINIAILTLLFFLSKRNRSKEDPTESF